MKKILITLLILVLFLNLTAQKIHTVAWYSWSNPQTFRLSPEPLITGWGVHSDSLSKVFNGTAFYEFNGEYYSITTWAEYYLWFVNKYWYNFTDPQLYEYYFLTNDDYEMARYIAGDSFQGHYYPSRINVTFIDKPVDINRLSTDSKNIASNNKKVKKLEKQIEFSEDQYKKGHFIKLHQTKTNNEFNKNEHKQKTTNNTSTFGNSNGSSIKSQGKPSSNPKKKSGHKTIK